MCRHELRSPLTSIYSFSTIIADGLAGETSPQQNEYLQIILRNVRQLQSMIEDLLEVTQAQAGKLKRRVAAFQPERCYRVCRFHPGGSAKEKEIVLSYQSSADMPLAYADAMRVRQVLTILVDNAVKYYTCRRHGEYPGRSVQEGSRFSASGSFRHRMRHPTGRAGSAFLNTFTR